MKIRELYIDDYKKIREKKVIFDYKVKNKLIEKIYKDIEITAIIGSNGSGKTTILSFIAMIFRYLQRNQQSIPSDFRMLYEIETNTVYLEKNRKNIFIKINNGEKKLLLEMERRDCKNAYSRKKWQENINVEDVTYDEIKKFLPSNILVSGFDIDYNIQYPPRMIGDRIVKLNKKYYLSASIGEDISLGINRVYEQYFKTNSKLKNIFNAINIKFSRYQDFAFLELIKNCNYEFEDDYEKNRYKSVSNDLRLLLKKYKVDDIDGKFEEIASGAIFNKYIKCNSEDNVSKKIDIEAFIVAEKINSKIIEILIKHKSFYFNNVNLGEKFGYSFQEMSTGEKMILGRIFFILSNIEKNSLILLEEPELHLNCLWVKHLIQILVILIEDYSPHFILSSHNYYFVNNLFNSQVLVLDGEQIKEPCNNTFLADHDTILEMISKNKIEYNYMEKVIFDILNKNNVEDLKMVFENIGESYIKVWIFKKLVEFGEINVEIKKR